MSRWASWAAARSAFYGMNFDHMPELHWRLGYSFAILLMAPLCTVVFKRRDWL
ncbi:CorA family divalent cation transporter [Streptomyces sp. NPDC005551]|uniref:CorA family divalent cation transporter n=1 Tax=Streptomyces sp. NPDC005551 TaxID=3364725 RepID=UPI0036C27B1F